MHYYKDLTRWEKRAVVALLVTAYAMIIFTAYTMGEKTERVRWEIKEECGHAH